MHWYQAAGSSYICIRYQGLLTFAHGTLAPFTPHRNQRKEHSVKSLRARAARAGRRRRASSPTRQTSTPWAPCWSRFSLASTSWQAALWRASAPARPGAHRVGGPSTAAHDRAAYCTRPDAHAGRGLAPLARRRSARSGPGRRARTWVPAGSSSSPVSSVPSVAPTEYTTVARLSTRGASLTSEAARATVELHGLLLYCFLSGGERCM